MSTLEQLIENIYREAKKESEYKTNERKKALERVKRIKRNEYKLKTLKTLKTYRKTFPYCCRCCRCYGFPIAQAERQAGIKEREREKSVEYRKK